MSEIKEGNPKQANGIKKVQYHVVPATVVAELSLALLEGALKYGSYNWRVDGVRASTYYDACKRHLDAWIEGEDLDPETAELDDQGQPIEGTGVHHIVKAIACLTVLRDSQIYGNDTDDRPPSSKTGWMSKLNTKAVTLINKYPNPKAPNVKK